MSCKYYDGLHLNSYPFGLISISNTKTFNYQSIQLKHSYKLVSHLQGNPLLSSSIGVDIFFSLILSYFCRFVAAFSPCHGKLPLRKYISTQPNDSISSRRLCSGQHQQVGVLQWLCTMAYGFNLAHSRSPKIKYSSGRLVLGTKQMFLCVLHSCNYR